MKKEDLVYHNMDLINEMVEEVIKLDGIELESALSNIQDYKESTEYEYDKIGAFTAPEEVTRRTQALAYYMSFYREYNKKKGR